MGQWEKERKKKGWGGLCRAFSRTQTVVLGQVQVRVKVQGQCQGQINTQAKLEVESMTGSGVLVVG